VVAAPVDGRTWYQVMGLGASASASEIRSAYLQLARNLHPDRHASSSETEQRLAERRMREVNAAWAVLGDPDAKSQYDTELRLAAARAATRPGAPRVPPTAARTPPSAQRSTVPPPPGAPGGPPPSRPRHHRFDGAVIDEAPGADEVQLTHGEAFLLRRVPVLIAIAIVIGIFIVSAYAGGGDAPTTPSATTTTAVVGTGP
jgi:curved DNA-binding protein CbpA